MEQLYILPPISLSLWIHISPQATAHGNSFGLPDPTIRVDQAQSLRNIRLDRSQRIVLDDQTETN